MVGSGIIWIWLILGFIELNDNVKKEGFYLLIIPKSFRTYICIKLIFEYLINNTLLLYYQSQILKEAGKEIMLKGWQEIFIGIDTLLGIMGVIILVFTMWYYLGKIKNPHIKKGNKFNCNKR